MRRARFDKRITGSWSRRQQSARRLSDRRPSTGGQGWLLVERRRWQRRGPRVRFSPGQAGASFRRRGTARWSPWGLRPGSVRAVSLPWVVARGCTDL